VFTLFSAILVAGAIVWAVREVVHELAAMRQEQAKARVLALLRTFSPAIAEAATDPRTLLTSVPLAKASRALYPQEFAELDRAAGGTFPFTAESIQAAHSRWTAEWLAWEYAHTNEYKLKAAAAEEEFHASGGTPVMRARLDAVEREKLERYQRRYEEYVRIAKALQALVP
jgi:hypothetical protein